MQVLLPNPFRMVAVRSTAHIECRCLVTLFQILVGGVLPTVIVAVNEARAWRQFSRRRRHERQRTPARSLAAWCERAEAAWKELSDGEPVCMAVKVAGAFLLAGALFVPLWHLIVAAHSGGEHVVAWEFAH